MIRALAEHLADWCIETGGEDADKEIVAYGLECRITDIVQTTILVALALLLGRPAQVMLYCLCFTSLKQSMGGYHAPNHLLCIVGFSGLTATGSLLPELVSPLLRFPVMACCVLVTLGASLIVKPKAHPNHPKSEQAGQKSHKRAVCIALLQAIFLITLSKFLPQHSFIWLAGALGGLTAALTLIISRARG